MAAPLIWDFHVRGAGEASRQLQAVGSATKVVKNDTVEYSKELRRQALDARAVINQDLYRARILVAQHPLLRNVTQATQMMTSVLRTAVAVQTMLNTAMLLSQGANAAQIENANALARAQGELNDMRSSGLEDTVAYQEKQEEVNVLTQSGIELAKQSESAWLNNAFGFVTGGALIAGSIVQLTPRFAVLIKDLRKSSFTLRAFGLAGWAALGPLLIIIVAVGLAAAAIAIMTGNSAELEKALAFIVGEDYAAEIMKWDESIVDAAMSMSQFGSAFVVTKDVLEKFIPWVTDFFWPTLVNAFVGMFNTISTSATNWVNGMIKGIESLANSIIKGINQIISGLNSISPVKIKSLASISLPQITAPQMGFMSMKGAVTGAGGGSAQNTGVGGAGSFAMGGGAAQNTGKTNIFNVTVQGSIITEKQLSDTILRELEKRLIDRGM